MQIPEIAEDMLLMVPLLLLVEGVLALVVWLAAGAKGGRGARIAAWLGLVTLTLWCGAGVAFIALHLLLFAFGPGSVVIGVIATAVFMATMPFGWALVMRSPRRTTVGRP